MRPGRGVALGLVAAAALAAACGGRRPLPAAVAAPAAAESAVVAPEAAPSAPPAPADLFQTEVKPLLMRRCAPCHAPGGRLYARLPFDDPEIVRPRYEKMRGRLSAEERAVLERWLDLPLTPAPGR